MKIGIIGAMEEEVTLLRDKIENRQTITIGGSEIYTGQLHGVDVALLKSGIGKVAAAMGATLLLERCQPDVIINTGSAGGLASTLKVGDIISRNKLLYGLVDALYTRSETEFKQGTFRVKGDTVDIYIAYGDKCYRVVFYDNEIEAIYAVDPMTGQRLESLERIVVYPANLFVTTRERIERAIREIQLDLGKQCEFFESVGRPVEARRLKQRVEYDLEMIKELGYCPGIENYSRYFDGRAPGSRPFCLIDYFPKDFLLIVDESHVTIPQIRGMYGGDASRKHNLVEYGYRLPAAVDNRPLRFEEFESLENEVIYVSATPADYELIKSEGAVVEQFIRPTGLVDPSVEIRPTFNQIDDLVEEIDKRARVDERILVTTLTKRMAEELYKYFDHMGIRCRYIHSDVDTLERVQILDDLRAGLFDVLIGVNLLREGLDLPEVSLVAIMDADKEGFLRSARSLTQTSGRAARNVGGRVIMYADTITDSMRLSIQDTNRRREKQLYYNATHAVMPKQAIKSGTKIMSGESLGANYTLGVQGLDAAADPVAAYMTDRDIDVAIRLAREAMESAARDLDFTAAARYRDQMYALQERQKVMQGTASDKRPGPKK